jgi:glycosyltransferase involved in cell wall biosynthesis
MAFQTRVPDDAQRDIVTGGHHGECHNGNGAEPLSRHPVCCSAGQRINRQSVVVVFTKPLWPIEHGNQQRAYNVLRWLKDSGCHTVLIMPGNKNTPVEPPGKEPPAVDELIIVNPDDWRGRVWDKSGMQQRDAAAEEALEFFRGKISWCTDAMRIATHEACCRFSPVAVIANYIFMAPVFQGVPAGILRIIDTIDMFSRQHEMVKAYGVDAPLACPPDVERNALLAADVLVAIQPHEQKLLQRLTPELKVIHVGMAYEPIVAGDVDENTLLFVGSPNIPNNDGLHHFLSHVWPLLRHRVPSAVLRIAGRICRELKVLPDGVELLGYNADLTSVYSRAAIAVNVTRVGTGLKIKSVEAISNSKPLVSWPAGLEGLPEEPMSPFVRAENNEQFAEAISSLLGNSEHRIKLQRNAYEYTIKYFSSNRVFKDLGDILLINRRNVNSLGEH